MSLDPDLGQTNKLASEKSTVDAESDAQNQAELLGELRHLLFAPEQEELSKIKKHLNDPEQQAQSVSNVLPRAFALSIKRDERLGEALQPTIETAIKVSVKKDPRTLVDALFPVMGPAIRKAIAQTLSTMLQSLNQTLENSFSAQGLKWRLEAFRTGRTFAEIVLLKTLLYRVEQVFLIHKETGLLLQHMVSPILLSKGTEIQDADMVSGMFSAIQDFVRDSFQVGQNESLQELRMGDLTVWIEQGPQALLAGVLRGNTPKELRATFQEALEKIHLEQSTILSEFQGDASIFENVRPLLEPCLESQYEAKKDEKKLSPAFLGTFGVISTLLLIWFSVWLWHYWHWQIYLDRLNSEPGIVITQTSKQGSKYFIAGLVDPLATNPEELRKQAGLSEKKVISRWEPYQAMQPKFILARAKDILQTPETVNLRLENNVLIASGKAPNQWIRDAKRWSRVIAGVSSFKEDNLIDQETEELEQVKLEIEKQYFLFVNGKTQFIDGEEKKLSQLVTTLKKLISLAESINKRLEIRIIGQTDEVGTQDLNLSLSKERATKMVNLLATQNIDSKYFSAVGIGVADTLTNTANSQQNSEVNRRVSFQISVINTK
ncbi:MAG: OmpA family protein [Blastocatellia bacterium]|nr:OmpA family protein [Blastocatellia bacterium]